MIDSLGDSLVTITPSSSRQQNRSVTLFNKVFEKIDSQAVPQLMPRVIAGRKLSQHTLHAMQYLVGTVPHVG